jgi:hypothetical protein
VLLLGSVPRSPRVEPQSSRGILKEEKGFPQLLIRMSYGQNIKPTPRREVDEVIL